MYLKYLPLRTLRLGLTEVSFSGAGKLVSLLGAGLALAQLEGCPINSSLLSHGSCPTVKDFGQ